MNDKKNKNKISFSLFIISILTFFLLWVILAEPIGNFYVKNFKKSDINFILPKNNKDLDLEKFWDVYNLLKKKYYSLDWIKKQDLVDGAISWMVEAIWDPHTEFMSSKIAKEFEQVMSWDFEGIGAVVRKNPLGVEIDRVLKGSPAKKAWLKKWDIIIEANGKKLQDLSLPKAVEQIKWPANTKVILKILRAWEDDILTKEITRQKIKIPTVETKDFWKIGYIALNMSWENSSEEFKKAFQNFKNKAWIIIDLRDNWWGYLQSAVEILSNFIENWKKLVEVKWKNILDDTVYRSNNFWEKYSWKIVILVNSNTASASEITSWALKDYWKAILIWTKTYWKWSVQTTEVFPDWSLIKYTIAKWFTPKWVNIDKHWILPDLKVEFKKQDYDLETCKKVGACSKNMKQKDFKFYDRQLEVAKKVLQDFIKLKDRQKTIDKFLSKNKEYNPKTWSWKTE